MENRFINNCESLVLGTLSFYEAMTFAQVILDLDAEVLKTYPQFTKEDLELILKNLVNKKLIKPVKIDREVGWVRIHPRKSWWRWPFFL